ncbi:ribosome small subunit-dependent GTPase A [Arthrobacter sp. BB-1]|uniref:ribosome small subunit-dependent GTPase A n=1 Tax=Micrococcaceae TaxID=1268 RepID=UPI001111E635|nr:MULTISPECIES: ribosome small subunit-dependent GTPase A [Micrococcaceae]TNB76622.1 ribosome small subunit-dependent GTPase A [Arthrobacter sp. BB-1]UEL28651.1 ribosome small subunit-dependent GTPase A [Pseudarthrobacter sp. L1SW]
MNISTGSALDSSNTSSSTHHTSDGPLPYGYTPAVAQHFNDHPVPAATGRGRVVRVDRNLLLVAAGPDLLHLPYPLGGEPAVTGDWVWLGPNRAGERQILSVLPRRSELSRKRAFEASSEAQVLAANMDAVGVVVPVDRPLTHNRLERTLVAAWDSGATPLVIITKADLADVADDVVGKVILQAAGVDVVTTSAETGDGIDQLLAHIPAGGTIVLLGPSGAGKSTLINALVGHKVQDTGEVRSGDFKGKHTTTSRELVPLANGTVLMDTPGVRGFGLFDAEDGLGEMFGDVEALAAACRFSDCAHQGEPGCAVQAAIHDGTLEERRWHNYLKLQRELAALARRSDAAAQRAYQREWHQKVVSAGKSQRWAERETAERKERAARKRR